MTLTIKENIIPSGKSNRPGIKLKAGKPEWLTIHETGNTSRGANARMHNTFLLNGGGSANVSFHYVVDDHEVYKNLPDNEVAWHAGDGSNGTGNSRSIGIETCVNIDGNWQQTLANLVELVKMLMTKYNIPIERVQQHNRFSSFGKDCPHNMRMNSNQTWNWFLAQLQPPVLSDSETFAETGKTIRGDFLSYFRDNGKIKVFGFPITDELESALSDGTRIQIQWFERARFERHPDGVKLGLVGREALDASLKR